MHLLSVLRRFILAAIFFAFASVSAQVPSFNYHMLGGEEGLNNANIFNIRQNSNGLMYFTTQNGIYYYDGYACSKLEIDSLRTNALLTVAFKSDDELYLSIRNEGLAVYNLRTKKYSIPQNLKIPDNNADEIIIQGNYAYLLNSRIRLVIKDIQNNRLISDEVNRQNRLNQAFCIYRTRSGKILLGRSDGLYEVHEGKQKKLDWAGNTALHSLTEDRDGKLLAGTTSGIVRLNGTSEKQVIQPVYKKKTGTFDFGGDNTINNIIADDFGRIWFTSTPDENLYLQINNATHDMFGILGIPSSLIRCIYKDRDQNIWIGTYSEGVYCIQNTFFENISFFYNNKNLNVNQATLKENILVSATGNGLYALNLSNNQSKTLSRPDETFTEPVFGLTDYGDVTYYTKFSQFYLSPAVFIDNKRAYKFKPVIAKIFYPVENNQSIIADRELNILLCNGDGSKVLDTLISFTDYRLSVNVILKKENKLYIGTNSGLFLYDFTTRHYANINESELSFNINDLAVINGQLLAAHEAGITNLSTHKLIRQAGKFTLNSVRRIRQRNKQIWLATLDGVFICDSNLVPVKILNKSCGLLSNSVNDVTVAGNKVLIASARGVSIADYNSILKFSSVLKPVIIHRVQSNGEDVKHANDRYALAAEQDNISIGIYSPVYQRPNNQYFRYRVDAGEWTYARNITAINIAVTGGRHRMEISASMDNIQWSAPAVLMLTKEQKLSERQSVYGLITIGIIAFIILISTIWVRRVKVKARKRLEVEQQVNLLKHQAMNALLSPHFIFNSLTSIQNYINTNNSLRASEYLAKFSRLIRMIIEKAAQSEISLHDELSRLTYYLELEKERFKNKFDYSIRIDENINTHQVMIPNMIIQPYVENCILHGILPKQQHGELRISFRITPGRKLLITIEDNGIGLIKAAEHAKTGHKSLGTSTIRNILEVNTKLTGREQNVTMTDKSTLNPDDNGTIITIEIEM
jgi:two-component sensor histidine kinase